MLGIALAAALQLQASSSPPSPAPESVDVVLRRGVELRMRGDNEHAVLEFRRAYALEPTPRTAAQLGLAEQALMHWAETDRYLNEALAATGDAWVARHRETLEAAVQWMREHVGTLDLRGGVDGAEILVDGVTSGSFPVTPIRLRAGTYTVEVRLAGYYPLARRVVVDPDRTTTESFELRPRQSVEISSERQSPAASAAPVRTPARSTQGGTLVPWIVGIGFVAVVFAGVGVGVMADREVWGAAFNDRDSGCRDPSMYSIVSQFPYCQTYYRRGEEIDLPIGITAFAAAALAGGTATYLLVREARRPRHVSASCAPWPTMTGGGCTVRF